MSDKPTVVLLHGLLRTRRSMSWLQARLEELGYPTWAETYPSRDKSIADLALHVTDEINAKLAGRELCAVTHSLGGILVRHMTGVRFKSVVMLAPPNQGSRVARTMRNVPLFKFIYGPVGSQMGDSVNPNHWPPSPPHCGIIAGTRNRSAGNPTSWLTRAAGILPPDAPGDGTLLVEETRLEGAEDFITVDASHTWILRHPAVPGLINGFFERGKFGGG